MLRPYQKEAIASIINEWNSGNKKTLLVAATGTGKTVIFAELLKHLVNEGKRCLVLAHRGELLYQAIDKIEKITGISCGLEKAENTCVNDDNKIIVASIQTLMQDKRLASFSHDYFDVIIVDEAHHITSDSYQKVLSYFNDSYVLGVTATPDRADERALSSYFDSKAYEYPIQFGIAQGYLSPIKILTLPVKIDITKVGIQSGDFAAGDLGDTIEPYLYAIAQEMKKYCVGRQTIIFTPLIKTSQKFLPILKEAGFKVAEINGGSKDRTEILEDLKNRKIDVILNSMLLTEGFDCPSIDCIINLRATKSKSLMFQMIGRGTRLNPGKDHLLILDFLWQTKSLGLLHPSALIAENDQQRRIMDEIASDGSIHDIFELDTLAQEEIVRQREAAVIARLKLLRAEKKKLCDPMQFIFSIKSEDLMNYEPIYKWEKDPITDKQKKAILGMGIDIENVKTKGLASHIMDVLMNRVKAGLSTPKQIKLLEQRGFTNVGMWTKSEASDMITKIANNHWHVPYGIYPKSYKPRRK